VKLLAVMDFVEISLPGMAEEIKANMVYTTEEARTLLRVSESTIKRLLKKGILRANKVGRQYRILGKEILRLISPELEQKAVKKYLKAKKKAVEVISRW
jgi:excisionase family DNA binding protein